MTDTVLVDPREVAGLSTTSPDPAAPVVNDAIVVRLGAGRFAVDLGSVAEVGRAPLVTRVPGLAVWLTGVANWRGRILPILDLRTLLGAAAVALDSNSRLIVLTDSGIAVGLLVDAIEGTTALTDVAPFPSASAPIGLTLVSGQSPREDGPLAVLDVAAIMRLRESLPRGRRSA